VVSEDTASRNVGILLATGIVLFVINWGFCVGRSSSEKCEPQLDKAGGAITAAVSTYLAFIYRRKEGKDGLTEEGPGPQLQGWPAPQPPTSPRQAPRQGGPTPRLPLVDPPRGEDASGAPLSGTGEWRGR
jgi:hypothetical protein